LKNILYVSPNGFLGGAEKFLLEAITAHINSGRDRVRVLFFNEGSFSAISKVRGFSPIILPFKFRLSHLPSLLKAMLYIRSKVKSEKIEIIHSTMAYTHIVMYLSTLGLKTKHIWFQHGPVSSSLDKIAALLPADIILFNSTYLRDEHFKFNSDLYHSKTSIIPLGVKSNAFKPRSHGPLKLLLAGRMAPVKGFHLVLGAIGKLLIEYPDLSHLLKVTLVGGAHSEKELFYLNELKQKIHSLKGTIELLPFTEDMDAVYSKHDLLIQPSLIGEGFGLVLAEAMGHSLLVAGPIYGGANEILHDGITGITFDFNSKEAVTELAEFLESAIDNFGKYENIRRNGLAFIKEKHSTENMLNQLCKVYDNL
jgi:glycosyltransferase involved in cell wall biosynthesis